MTLPEMETGKISVRADGETIEVYPKADKKLYARNSDGVEYDLTGQGSILFTGLTDTPPSYTGQGGKLLAVKPGEDGVEFVTQSDGTITKVTKSIVVEELLYEEVLSAAGVFDLQNISQDYDHLKIMLTGKRTGSELPVGIELNGDTDYSNHYETQLLYSAGSAANAWQTATNYLSTLYDSSADELGQLIIDIQNYRGTDYKYINCNSTIYNTNTLGLELFKSVTQWNQSAAINRIRIQQYIGGTGLLDAGASIKLYGIRELDVLVDVQSPGGIGDQKAAISSSDTTSDFLEEKIVAGSNISITKENTGGDEALRISAFSGGDAIPTGVILPFAGKGSNTPTGWLLSNGQTVGDASSGADHTGANMETLFTHLWNNFANAELPVQDSSGSATTRGASANDDWLAQKRLPLPDLRGRVPVGLDDMNDASSNPAGRVTGAWADVVGGSDGEENHQLSVAEMPSHNHTIGIYQISGGSIVQSNGGALITQVGTKSTSSVGSGLSHNNMQPSIALSYIIKM